MENRIVVKCKNVGKTFIQGKEENEVLKGVNLAIKEEEFVVLFGLAETGKTTLLNLIAGLEPVTEGTIEVNDEIVDGPKPNRGMVYQTTSLFPWLTVLGNVEFGPAVKGIKKTERRKKAQYYIDLVGLSGFEKTYPIKLSGGMTQRVGIARADCNEPKVILMDEPFGHLDAQTRYLMEEEIERICAKEKRTVIFVTNNIEEAVYLADRILVLSDKPSHIVKEYQIDLPRPRNITAKEFLRLRKEITDFVERSAGEVDG